MVECSGGDLRSGGLGGQVSRGGGDRMWQEC